VLVSYSRLSLMLVVGRVTPCAPVAAPLPIPAGKGLPALPVAAAFFAMRKSVRRSFIRVNAALDDGLFLIVWLRS